MAPALSFQWNKEVFDLTIERVSTWVVVVVVVVVVQPDCPLTLVCVPQV